LGRNRRKWGGLKAKYRRRFKLEKKRKEAMEKYGSRKKYGKEKKRR
tara:strand:+ start:976 stop:1113 length:138 start_codon:yes stop_codon:yes gene_type:complete